MKTTKETVKRVFVANEDFTTRNGQSEESLQCNGYVLKISGRYPNGRKFYDECRREKPDIIVSDIFLDELDLLTILKKFNENFYNPIVIAIGPKNQIFVDMALNHGCRYYISGNASNETIINNINLLIASDVKVEDNGKGIISSEDYVEGIVEDILVREFGVPYSILGFSYLRDAIAYVLKTGEKNVMNIGITKTVYPDVAKKHKSTSSRVERNIRTAIEKACCNAGYATLEKYFGKSCNEYKENPTNSLFICTVARRILGEYTLTF